MAHMRNMAFRHRRAARKMAAKFGPEVHDYVVVDPAHRPDLRGELAGAKVRHHDGKQLVKLSPKAARFYLDSGSIVPLHQPKAEAEQEEHVERETLDSNRTGRGGSGGRGSSSITSGLGGPADVVGRQFYKGM